MIPKTAENSALHHRNKLYIYIIQIENIYFITFLTVLFDQINAALTRRENNIKDPKSLNNTLVEGIGIFFIFFMLTKAACD